MKILTPARCGLVASLLFVVLAIAAHRSPYFGLDLTITRTLQRAHQPLVSLLMRAESWPGYLPQAAVITWVLAALLVVLRHRWAGFCVLFAATGPIVGELVKEIVQRTRPPKELVNVVRQLDSLSYPSGHVVWATTIAGFVAYLLVVRLRPSGGRTAAIVALAAFVLLMGASRIYLGAHWFSDTIGGYLLGIAWLSATVALYQWGTRRPAGRPRRASLSR